MAAHLNHARNQEARSHSDPRLFALIVVGFGACTILIGNRAPIFCDGSEPRCDGSVLVRCAQSLEIKKDCGTDPVSATYVSICGDGWISSDEECDDGN
jgi:hypothetical protein